MIKNICVECNKEFDAIKVTQRYCSKKCNRKKYIVKKITKRCLICNEEFIPKYNNKRYCSIKCISKARIYIPKKITKKTNCVFCNKEIFYIDHYKKYCSLECAKSNLKLTRSSDIYINIRKEKFKKRLETNENVKIATMLHYRFRGIFRLKSIKKDIKCKELIGCSYEEYIKHLNFPDGINIYNYGKMKYHIDHYIPKSYFDLTIKENQKLCFYYKNTRLITEKENLEKGDKLPTDYKEFLEFLKKERGIV